MNRIAIRVRVRPARLRAIVQSPRISRLRMLELETSRQAVQRAWTLTRRQVRDCRRVSTRIQMVGHGDHRIP